MEWKKAGGQLLHEEEQRKKPLKVKKTQIERADRLWDPTAHSSRVGLETDLLEFLVSVVGKIY